MGNKITTLGMSLNIHDFSSIRKCLGVVRRTKLNRLKTNMFGVSKADTISRQQAHSADSEKVKGFPFDTST
jgi:hypothetical protein